MTEAEIQYLPPWAGPLQSLQRPPHSGARPGFFGNFRFFFRFVRGQTMDSTIENSLEIVFLDQLRVVPLTKLDLSTIHRPVWGRA